MKKTVVLTVVLIMAMTGFAWAGTDAGYKELGINGSYSNTTNSENDNEDNMISLGIVYNYFFNAYFSIGANYRISGSQYKPEVGDTRESTNQFLNLRADLLAGGPTKTVIPYIGVHGGGSFYYSESEGESTDDSTFAYGAQGGLKMFPSERVSVNLELDYTTTEREDLNDETYEVNQLSLFIGASFYF